ncbi:MAG: hypothetical protein R3F22_04665 [Lysobacteraceae bacterium]
MLQSREARNHGVLAFSDEPGAAAARRLVELREAAMVSVGAGWTHVSQAEGAFLRSIETINRSGTGFRGDAAKAAEVMVSQARLNALMEAIGGHEKAEVEFFRALLDTVYAHVPPSDDSGRLRFIQFIAPEGDTLLPFFTDQAKADFAARGHAKVVAMTGGSFSASPSATLTGESERPLVQASSA